MTDCDLVVLGAGPAGSAAALAAVQAGLNVVLVDENHAPGGQVYRPSPPTFASEAAHRDPGAILRARVAESSVRTAFSHQVWSVSPGFRVDAIGPDGPVSWQARGLVVATGTTERVVPFPGWTTPGVIGLAGATIALKAQHGLPGARPVIAGCGPLLLAVAGSILEAGGRVAAIVDIAGPSNWARLGPSAPRRPDLVGQATRWSAAIWRNRVPVLRRHGIAAVEPLGDGLLVRTQPVDEAGRPIPDTTGPSIETDALAVGHGLVPNTEITRLLGTEHAYSAAAGGWTATRDALGRSTVPGLYIAGDGAGITGAKPAAYEGQLAGLAAAADLGGLAATTAEARAGGPRRKLGWTAPFGAAVARLLALREGQVDAIPTNVTVCRCEDITRAEIDAAIRDGARDVNQLKAWTRCGMGPCQGRTCGDIVGALVAGHQRDRAAAGLWTARVPLRPVPVDLLTGSFAYSDIPIPKAAPL